MLSARSRTLPYSQKNPSLSKSNRLLSCHVSGNGCLGGWAKDAFNYVRAVGIASAASYPYVHRHQRCSEDQVMRFATIDSWAWVPSGDTHKLMQVCV